ncbi:hypothetical protein DPEC_G00187110 [Dallia pectoralis]|uniref:Uncharacterized protein n=1 Tax=Dallia pectoralis TaxID=75939 RepID=A0ACC2GBW9_DALPE|nr:hypothetical protein DPEC_G00187110 [Dallia pectoralis]
MHSGLCLTLLSVSLLNVHISAQPVPETFNLTVPDGPISSHSGSSVDLLCQVSPVFNIQPFEVQWYWPDVINKPALLYKDQTIQEDLIDQRFRGRVSLIGGLERGNASLRLERVTLEDRGEFVCYIASKEWYDKASVVLTVSVIGSQPVISVAETRGGQVNVTCSSEGWSPEPKVTWRNKEGAEISNGQEVQNIIDSQGLVRVSSSLLYSPSESEWLSCIVSLSDKWKTEGRILPTLPSGDSIEGFTVNQVLLFVLSVSLVINFICGLYFFIGFKRNGFKCSSVHKSRKNKETKTLIEENIQEGQKMEETTLIEVNNQEGQKIEDLLQGKRLTSLKREHFTMDPKTASSAIRLSHINKKIQYIKTKDKSNPQMSLHVLGNKGFDSGQHYWQVTVKEDNKNEKLA